MERAERKMWVLHFLHNKSLKCVVAAYTKKSCCIFCQGNNIIISWRCYILFLVVWRCQKCIWKLLWTALYLFNALLKDGRRSNTLAQLSLHYIKSSENHGAQMFFIKLNLTPLFLTMTYPWKSISSCVCSLARKGKMLKRLRIECAVYLLLTTSQGFVTLLTLARQNNKILDV